MLDTTLNYVAAGAEGFFKNGKWSFDLNTMPIDYYLINASTFVGSKNIEQIVKQKEEANAAGKQIFVDSGGFQLATETIDYLDPQGIVEVQNRTANQGFILDVPTMRRTRGAGAGGLELDASPEYFNHCLTKTIGHLNSAKHIPRNFEYYAVVQGVSVDQLQAWWTAIQQVDTYQGIGTKGVILEQVLSGLFFMETNDIDCHHILGLGAAQRILLVRYFYMLSKKTMKRVTYDNTNHIQYAKYMQAVMPFLNCFYDKNENKEHFEKFSGVKMDGISPNDMTTFISTKNLYYYGLQNRLINLLSTPTTVRDFVVANFKAMEIYLNCIDDFFDKGIAYVLKKYPDLDYVPKKVATSNLMDFI